MKILKKTKSLFKKPNIKIQKKDDVLFLDDIIGTLGEWLDQKCDSAISNRLLEAINRAYDIAIEEMEMKNAEKYCKGCSFCLTGKEGFICTYGSNQHSCHTEYIQCPLKRK